LLSIESPFESVVSTLNVLVGDVVDGLVIPPSVIVKNKSVNANPEGNALVNWNM
jgi:hypothetical protein